MMHDASVSSSLAGFTPSVGEHEAGEALLAAFARAACSRVAALDEKVHSHHCVSKRATYGIAECVRESAIEERLETNTFLCSESCAPAGVDLRLAAAIVTSAGAGLTSAIKGLKENGCGATSRWLATVSRTSAFRALVGKEVFDEHNELVTKMAATAVSANGQEEKGKSDGVGIVTKKGRARVITKGDGTVLSSTGDAKNKQEYYKRRVDLFDTYYERVSRQVDAAKALGAKLTVRLPDGNTKEGVRGVTTAMDIALGISKGLASKAVVAKVNGAVWDLTRPLEEDCSLEICTFDCKDGQETFWHSSSHLLGLSLELELGADLTIGPPHEKGFYYDCFLGDRTLNDEDLLQVQKRVEVSAKEKHPFLRAVVSRDEALDMFQENKFKLEMINALPEDEIITVYKVGPMVDLCTGPHLPHSGLAKSVWVSMASRSFWRADVNREHLMRVYGISFPDEKMMKKHKHNLEEAKKRDHRLLGTTHDLFFFHQLSPGSCFFTPFGARLYHSLMGLIRDKYWEFEYQEVITPNIFNFQLWHRSGHADHYKANMFSFNIESEEFGMKPMNCPAHCLMFKERARSYRDLPYRLADFGVLHRNEFSGALHGLTRVRRFQQDDAHIFCRPDQVQDEVRGFLRFLDEVYDVFGLEYELNLSTRPDDYLGELDMWDKAEAALENALNDTGREWKLNPGDGAFYGPKIDIEVFDALERKYQCATVQLDFQLPIRFDLKYACDVSADSDDDRYARPVIVHRAVLGSVERMLAILTEHFACKWPLWLNPKQVMIVPVSQKFFEYATTVRRKLRAHRFFVDLDKADEKMQKKVRKAQLAQYNYILVVGQEEQDSMTVNVRTRKNNVRGAMPLDSLLTYLVAERDTRAKTSELDNNIEEEKK